jgi:DegV family protein with EDD domain
MKVKVFTDVTTFIPEELAKEYDIDFIELSVLMEDGPHKEKSIDREEFINKMKDMDPYPTTSQANPHDFLESFQKVLSEGYDHVFYVGLSINLSQSQNSANIAIKKLKKEQATVYDSEIMAPCQGIMALSASRLFKKGKSIEEVIAYLDSLKNKIYGAGLSSSFDVLFKTGKVKKGAAISMISTVMKLKPMFELNFEKGLISLGGGKGFKGAIKKIMENIQEKTDPETEYILVLSDVISPDLMKTMEEEIKKIRRIKEVHHWPISVVAAHTLGKGAVTAVLGPSWEI